MLRRASSLAVLGGIICMIDVAGALGFGGGALEVAQPLVAYEGIEVSRVSFVMGRPFGLVPGYNVYLTGKPSCVCNDQGESVNLNAASFLCIEAGYDPHHGATGRLLGDTIHVFMDLSGMKPLTEELEGQLRGWSVEAVVEATAECVLLTAHDCRFGYADPASSGYVEARYVWLEVRGSDKYSRLGGVFSFDELGPLPRKRLFH